MAPPFPDIICEYLDANTRHECGGVQIIPSLEPSTLATGGYALLILLMQNALDAPVDLTFKLDLPTAGVLRGSTLMEAAERDIPVSLEAAQVASVFVPVKAVSDARQGEYRVQIAVQAKAPAGAIRVRPASVTGHVDRDLLPDVVGLDVGRVLGVSYREVPATKLALPVVISGEADPDQEVPTMAVKFESLWKKDDLQAFTRAAKEVNIRRNEILRSMATEPLYVALYAETQKRLKGAGLTLRTGEAIGLGKILTFTARSLLDNADLQDGLLVPLWEVAQEVDEPVGDPLALLRTLGLGRLFRLSVAVAFSLVGKAYGEQPWTIEERRSLGEYISEKVDAGEELPIEFLYIPLLAAAAVIWPKLVLEGENPKESLRLLKQAKSARATIFTDPDLAQASHVFDRLTDGALGSM